MSGQHTHQLGACINVGPKGVPNTRFTTDAETNVGGQ
jgi:hypothetical protein